MKNLKLFLIFTIVLTAMVLLFAISASAEDTVYSGTWGGLTWELNATTGELVISGEGKMSNFDYYFTEAWDDYKNSIKSVKIGEDVTSIGMYAFRDCSDLTSITIPASVTSIGSDAFYGCKSLTSITIPASVTFIGSWAFYNCASLTSITIPEGVTSIGSDAFYGCKSLTSITIPASVTSIGEWAFYNCDGLTSITIPASVTAIGSSAFRNCSNLASITVKSGNTTYYSTGNCLIETASSTLILGCKNSVIPTNGSVTRIGSDAFAGCSGLTSITIPASVTSIDSWAFYNCSSLASITIPDSIASIGDYAFSGCRGLTSITIPENVSEIGKYAFEGCTALTEINYNAKNVSSAYYAFRNAGFYSKGVTVTIGANVTKIPNSIFRNYYDYTFCSAKITSVIFSDGSQCTSIGDYAFHGCSNLISITIPSSVKTIGEAAFGCCVKLIEVYNFSQLVITAGGNAHGYLGGNAKHIYTNNREQSKLQNQDGFIFYVDGSSRYLMGYVGTETSLILPNDCNGQSYSLYQYAFHNYGNLKSITIPENMTKLSEYAFYHCAMLSEINFNAVAMNDLYSSTNAFAFSGYAGTGITVNIGANVTKIPSYFFYVYDYYDRGSWTPNIICVAFAENSQCSSIGPSAFRDCWYLTSIVMPKSIISIGNYAFYNCHLNSITFPESLTSIGNYAFYDCHLTSITFPESLTSIGNSAFYGCSNLAFVTISSNKPSIGASAFQYCTSLKTVYIHSPNLLRQFSSFSQLGSLLLYADTVALTGDAFVPALITSTFTYTEDIIYQDTNYTAYSVHNHEWKNCSTYIEHQQAGFLGVKCSICALTKNEYGVWQKHDAEQHKRECTCGEVEYADHDWNDGVITTPATHLTIGAKTFTCSDCGEIYTVEVAKLTAHEYSKWQKHDTEQHKRICTCEHEDYAAHNWDKVIITTPATHLKLGIKTFTCSNCGETKTEEVAKLTAHEYGEWQKHNAEQHKRECPCDDVEYANHNWNSGVVSKAATHLEEGVRTFTCVGCGETQTSTIQKIAQHSYGAWTTVTEATKDAAGVQERSCACGHTDTKEIPQLESNVGVVVAIVGGGTVALGGGGFALYWFVFRKKKLI